MFISALVLILKIEISDSICVYIMKFKQTPNFKYFYNLKNFIHFLVLVYEILLLVFKKSFLKIYCLKNIIYQENENSDFFQNHKII